MSQWLGIVPSTLGVWEARRNVIACIKSTSQGAGAVDDLREVDERTNGGHHVVSARASVTPSSQDASQSSSTPQNPTAQAASTPENNATAAKKAVRAATIEFNMWQRYWLRRRLRYGAWRAKQNGAGDRLLWWLWPKKYGHNGFEEYFTKNASDFGDTIYGEIKPRISSRLTQRLEGFIDGDGEPFLIIRGVFSRRFLQVSLTKVLKDDPEEAEALLEKRRYNLVASALIAATKTELRRKLDQGNAYRDFITETSAEINQFVDGTDMHVRYRTATPEIPPATRGLNTAARIIVFACIENPIADPIYLIRVDHVIDGLSDRNKNLLREPGFIIFDKWNTPQLSMQYVPNSNKRVLHYGPSKIDWLSFDPNRICPANMDTSHNSAIGALMESIQKVAATSARKIVLRRGDALIVDNYRALTRRQERGYEYLVIRPPWMGSKPPTRWLRAYYGFPPSRTEEHAAKS
jgi:hypothetical protein